ncbi:putative ribonuclease BN [Mycobacteroides stephanolepidis]|uniref:Putative ribonuclease BN n=2 Tax=[Mycobacterium] stephanolepidis TaxID=1520670 RepID=A0A1Z4EZ85_9MYCO|nr:putative ribonuclease BN [[Mycobacterium] stephanolepidis]
MAMSDKPRHVSFGRDVLHVMRRTAVKSWDDSIFAQSAQAAFWQVLSLPPLLLGILGSLTFVGPLFGPDTLPEIQERILRVANSVFSKSVVTEIIEPTIIDIMRDGRGEVVSIGFVISLWAGSSAISSFVDSVVEAHDQTPLRHPVRQRFFALGLYVAALAMAVVTLPVIALGPKRIAEVVPDSWNALLRYGYFPLFGIALVALVTLLYRVSLPRPLPSHRLWIGALLAVTFFVIASLGLRFYLNWITRTGYTYGALATPIAFLLFAFMLGFAIVLGAELNAAIEENWPAGATHARQLREWLSPQNGENTAPSSPDEAAPDKAPEGC